MALTDQILTLSLSPFCTLLCAYEAICGLEGSLAGRVVMWQRQRSAAKQQ